MPSGEPITKSGYRISPFVSRLKSAEVQEQRGVPLRLTPCLAEHHFTDVKPRVQTLTFQNPAGIYVD